jgi:Tfp pilus assembly PilM family ATPase
MTLAMIGAATGGPVDSTNGTTKEALFCGSFTEDFKKLQESLLEAGLFPDAIELGSVAMLGGLLSYLAFTESKTPTLFLEIGMEVTNCYILNVNGVDLARPIALGVNSIIPLVQKELGLKDEESAAKLFFSNTFDFGGMGPALIKKLLKELQSSIGFYEVQTGQSIGQLVCAGLPDNLGWLGTTLGATLGVGVLKPDYGPWLKANGIEWDEANVGFPPGPGHFGLISLAGRFKTGATTNETK